MEKEVMDRTELRQLLELHTPGPRLVPGSEALPAPAAPAEAVEAPPAPRVSAAPTAQ
jgi:hypothetical protein